MATYYVDPNGSDSNNGLSSGSAWKTLLKVSNSTFSPGDNILLKSGATFTDMVRLKSSGSGDAPITFGSYGSGDKPTIKGSIEVASTSWTETSSNVWKVSAPKKYWTEPWKLWLDGDLANSVKASAANVTSNGDWFWKSTGGSGGELYVYSTSNPNSAFDSIKYSSMPAGFLIEGKSNITIDGIRVTEAHNGVHLTNGASNVRLLGLDFKDNAHVGAWLEDASNVTIRSGEYDNNGVAGRPGKVGEPTGAGVGIEKGSYDISIADLKARGNAEHAVVSGESAGNNISISNLLAENNKEGGVFFKGGTNHSITDSVLKASVLSPLGLQGSVGKVTLTDNDFIVSSPTSRTVPLVFTDQGKAQVVSTGNKYDAGSGYALWISSKSTVGSTFKDDLFIGPDKAVPTVLVENGPGHRFENVTVIAEGGNGDAIRISGGSVRMTESSVYGKSSPLVRDRTSDGYTGENNDFHRDDIDSDWLNLSGKSFSKQDITSNRVPEEKNSSAGTFTPAQLIDAWEAGESEPPGGGGGGGGGGGSGFPSNATWTGSNGADNWTGTGGNDVAYGQGGDDRLDSGLGNDTVYGGQGNDQIYVRNGSDNVDGGAGNDSLYGAGGNDTYWYAKGNGNDIILEGAGSDRILLDAGIAPSEVTLSKAGTDLNVNIAGGGSIVVQQHFAGSATEIDDIVFRSTGAAWNKETIQSKVSGGGDGGGDPPPSGGGGRDLPTQATWTGTSGAETFTGSNAVDVAFGRGGNDVLYGNGGNDTLYGEDGADRIYGGPGNDNLIGGPGNDRMYGGAGDDFYWYGLQGGADTINDAGGADRLVLDSAISRSDVSLSRSGADLKIAVAGANTITVQNHFDGSSFAVEQVEFQSNDTVVGTDSLLV